MLELVRLLLAIVLAWCARAASREPRANHRFACRLWARSRLYFLLAIRRSAKPRTWRATFSDNALLSGVGASRPVRTKAQALANLHFHFRLYAASFLGVQTVEVSLLETDSPAGVDQVGLNGRAVARSDAGVRRPLRDEPRAPTDATVWAEGWSPGNDILEN